MNCMLTNKRAVYRVARFLDFIFLEIKTCALTHYRGQQCAHKPKVVQSLRKL